MYKHEANLGIPQVKDLIFAGEISEQLNDPERDKLIKGVDLAAKSHIKTIGRPKSGCIWRKGRSTKNSLKNVSLKRKTWEEKEEERKKKASLKARVEELR